MPIKSVKYTPNPYNNIEEAKLSIDPKIEKLNNLINDYNQSGLPVDLLKVQSMSRQIYNDEISRKVKKESSGKLGGFMQWYLSDQVAMELHFKGVNPKEGDLYMLDVSEVKHTEDHLRKTNGSLDVKNWRKMTTPLIVLKGRSDQYTKMDNLIENAQKAAADFTGAKPEQRAVYASPYKDALAALQQQTLFMLNNEIPDNKPQMKNNFEVLLHIVNTKLKEMIKTESKRIVQQDPSDDLTQAIIGKSPEDQLDFVRRFRTTVAPALLNGFEMNYLGGRNNKNWLAINPETNAAYIVRLEKADDPITDYSIVHEMKGSPAVNQHLAKEYFYCPMEMRENGELRPINVAISEYFPKGNLRDHHIAYLADPSTEKNEICRGVIDFTEQVARIATDLQQNGLAYMDIKASNFLMRDDGKVVTADIKSVVRPNNENRIKFQEISTTYAAPEQRFWDPATPRSANAEFYMVYQIGIMAYELMLANTNKVNPIHNILNLKKGEPINFDYPVFKTKDGQKILAMIEAATHPDPNARSTLQQVLQSCRDLKEQLGMSADRGITLFEDKPESLYRAFD